ncbi:FAD-dependent oxidoreductase [Sphingomonas sp. MMS12-HWE2-04]|uniref:FAD-dependent oxidoreductase n=1 Tax=Sphingomonas sp. MMS12-HWE2-04 TaxID=3234199 RepID=UPI00384DCAB4
MVTPEQVPHPRETQIFPRLSAEMVTRMLPYGEVQYPEAGAYLFRRSERSVAFFVVLDGEVALLDEEGDVVRAPLRSYGPGEFTGELYLFNHRAVLVSAQAGPGTRVLRIEREAFRKLAASEADIGELLMRAFILRRVELIATGFGGVTLLGSAYDAETHRIRAFLIRNGYPYRLLDPDSEEEAAALVATFALDAADLPVLLTGDGAMLRNPGNADVADALGLTERRDPDRVFDLIVVGAGPSGLAAAVYAASEGLDTLVIEADAPGGQAGTSSRIENYLGFPTGISGQALAGRAQVQAQKFGAQLAISRGATGIDCGTRPFGITLEGGERVAGRSVLIATGARYRRLSVPDYDRLEGCGIYYAATPMEAQLCMGEEAVVVGGGNSAGQAAVFLARTCSHVHVLVRSAGLAETMSDYLVQRIRNSPQITLHVFSEITAVAGDTYLSQVAWRDRRSGAETVRPVRNLFAMIGAEPNTGWLDGCVPLDDRGFVLTGSDAAGTPLASPYATRVPGIFAVGDVRSGSIKRVASGVGEGSVVVSAVHQFLGGA